MRIENEQLERELKEFLVTTLNLEDLTPDEIESDIALFGEGLGLDSIDALELGIGIHKKYGVPVDAKAPETRQHFKTIRSLANFISRNRPHKTATL